MLCVLVAITWRCFVVLSVGLTLCDIARHSLFVLDVTLTLRSISVSSFPSAPVPVTFFSCMPQPSPSLSLLLLSLSTLSFPLLGGSLHVQAAQSQCLKQRWSGGRRKRLAVDPSEWARSGNCCMSHQTRRRKSSPSHQGKTYRCSGRPLPCCFSRGRALAWRRISRPHVSKANKTRITLLACTLVHAPFCTQTLFSMNLVQIVCNDHIHVPCGLGV